MPEASMEGSVDLEICVVIMLHVVMMSYKLLSQ